MGRTQMSARLLSAAYSLPGASTLGEMQHGSSQLLSSMIGCDEVLWTEVNIVAAAAAVRRGPFLTPDPKLSRALGRYGDQHPAVVSYLAPGDDRHPRRVSDVTNQRAWSSSPAYREIFSNDRAKYQLSLVVSLGGGVGRGWVLTRSSADFKDADVDIASLTLPLLVALDSLAQIRFITSEAPPPRILTDRELQVLQLLATGRTALAIGRAIGVSEATVRKHVQHIYYKLDCNDRLTAVLRARSLGMVAS